jgi:hypothetical protein
MLNSNGKFIVAAFMAAAAALIFAACSTVPADPARPAARVAGLQGPTPADIARDPADGLDAPLPTRSASSAFWKQWGDGQAEIAGYRIETSRYGEQRRGTVALIYVTEPMDGRTWIKDDSGQVPDEHRVKVIKLNQALKFQTGIYPYSVMTSVFSPVDGNGRERFAPAKISVSAQEWCGHVYAQIHPKGDHFWSEGHSYFGAEGDSSGRVGTAPLALYEDALLIQLRELDGPFASGGDWSGELIPTMWHTRKAHLPLQPVPATITRTDAARNGVPVTRFTVRFGELTRTIDVEKAAPRRVLGWTTSDGEKAELAGSDRLPYWKLNSNGDEAYLKRLGLSS